ncbi:MAG: amidohydrolase [Burkholderiaceae bacterium]|nr:amidohydrolase [Burkholderiaceae bacterium]
MNTNLQAKLQELIPGLVAVRRDLHKYPESAWTEFRTASMCIKKMQELGYAITMGEDAVKRDAMMGVPAADVLKGHMERAVAQGADAELVAKMEGGLTGFWADMDFGGEGPFLAVRFDMDCNDVSECDAADHRPNMEGYASVNKGAMHACGHDAHVAIALALAELVASMRDQFTGKIRFIFQPAEEGVRGAMPMEKAGAVEGVDQIFGMHIGFQANKLGKVICGTKNFLATTKADITFTGVPAHAGNAPEEGKNALLAAATALLNMHAIPRSGKGDTRITVGKLIGGEGRNVIPPKAVLVLETRGITSALDEYMFGEVKRIAKAAADMWGCGYSIDIKGGTKSGESDLEVAEVVAEEARAMGCFNEVIVEQNFGASEDYSHFMSTVQANGGKGTYVQVGSNLSAGHHNGHFDFDEKALEDSLVLMARCVYRTLAK